MKNLEFKLVDRSWELILREVSDEAFDQGYSNVWCKNRDSVWFPIFNQILAKMPK